MAEVLKALTICVTLSQFLHYCTAVQIKSPVCYCDRPSHQLTSELWWAPAGMALSSPVDRPNSHIPKVGAVAPGGRCALWDHLWPEVVMDWGRSLTQAGLESLPRIWKTHLFSGGLICNGMLGMGAVDMLVKESRKSICMSEGSSFWGCIDMRGRKITETAFQGHLPVSPWPHCTLAFGFCKLLL